MLFNSYIFLFAFLPVTLRGYFVLGCTRRSGLANAWLLLASLICALLLWLAPGNFVRMAAAGGGGKTVAIVLHDLGASFTALVQPETGLVLLLAILAACAAGIENVIVRPDPPASRFCAA